MSAVSGRACNFRLTPVPCPPFGLLIDERHQVEFFRDRGSPVHAVSLPLVDKNPLQAL
ncbi:hypothetical protein [Acidaminococcus fermentans]|uniref:hypothetical protein n=1 Tax=Acidaminococcus fermentans TaxID=905 RepID=UPI0024934FD7|nr:hypothetical protein [Acidaminococcus fermentans]